MSERPNTHRAKWIGLALFIGIVIGIGYLLGVGRPAYTLYREGRFGGPDRVHIATFDAAGSEEYNRHNCEYVVSRIMAEEGVTERHWCDTGASVAASINRFQRTYWQYRGLLAR